MKDNILHVVPTLKKDGAENQLLILLKELCSSFENIDLLTFDLNDNGNSIEKEIHGLEVNLIYCNKSVLGSFFYLYKLIKNRQYDIVHSHLPKSDILVGMVSLFIKFEHIVSVHAQYGTRQNEPKVKYFLLFPIWRICVNRSKVVVAISNKVKKWLISRGVSNKIEVVLYGIQQKESSHTPPNNNIIGMAARFLEWKGWDKLLDVAFDLKKHGVIFQLHLAGPDDEGYKGVLSNISDESGLEDFIVFHNEYENIYDFFDQIDIFIFLSESEGFGLVLLEAMAYGLPIVASDIAPINEFVDDETGILVNRSDSVEISNQVQRLLNSTELRKEMSRNQINKVNEHLSAAKMAQKIKELYYLP